MNVENVSNSLRRRLSGRLAHQSLKTVKAARRAGWALVERLPKMAPQGRPFSATGTEWSSAPQDWSSLGFCVSAISDISLGIFQLS